MSGPNRSYISKGQVLQSPPLAARLRTFFDQITQIVGLYLVTLFSLDAYAAAEGSAFNVRHGAVSRGRGGRGWGGGGRGGGGGSGPHHGGGGDGGGRGGGGAGGGGRRSGGKRLGTVDDVRGPECRSCQ
ncbi:MAG: hypothetical protein M1826_000511 [Phylliscum demangeonii]|nr:MAG: hypothetical protein M1826_000511 [Phylliscum demangeonii]